MYASVRCYEGQWLDRSALKREIGSLKWARLTTLVASSRNSPDSLCRAASQK